MLSIEPDPPESHPSPGRSPAVPDGPPQAAAPDATPGSASGQRGSGRSGSDDPIPSELLLDGRTEIRIRHRGEIYRLSVTRAGKLLLHK